jgi:hypothetical protein
MEVEAWGVAAGENTPPTVSITSPVEGASFISPAAVTLTASASDNDGVVQQVAYYANSTLIGSATVSPYSVNWTNVAAGTYTVTAVATDNAGDTTTSAAVHLSVTSNAAPTVSVTSPSEGANFGAPASVTVSANAADSDGTIASVAFYANGSPIGTDTSAPFSIAWNPVPAGNYTLTAVATDDRGATTTSSPVHISVSALTGRINMALAANGGSAIASSIYGANYPPSAAINGDRKGLNWGAGGGWNDGTPNASPDWLEIDFTGMKTIDEVDVFSMQDNYNAPVEPTQSLTFTSFGLRAFEIQSWNGSAWISIPGASITNNNLVWRQFAFSPVTTSRLRLYITAALNGYSRVMEVEAWGVPSGANSPPTVSISAPAEGASAIAPATFTVTAAASDTDGTVQQVTFYANGSPIGTDTSSPFSITWSNVDAASYTLTAVATDNIGASTTSAPVHVNVSAGSNPPGGRVNFAAAANGGTALASSTYTANYPPAAAINGDRKGVNWGAGGGWNDGTANTSPDWIEIDFNGVKTVDEVSVFSMQDNYSAPVEPTSTMTFAYWGLRAFQIQYWDGSTWVNVPGAAITNNNLVWRRFLFSAVTTSKIRVYITAALNGYSRVIEVEAWGNQ